MFLVVVKKNKRLFSIRSKGKKAINIDAVVQKNQTTKDLALSVNINI